MLLALALGAVLGYFALDPLEALPLLAMGLAVKGVFDVRYCHVQVLNRPSPYLHYCKNLMERDEDIGHAAFSYLLQLVVFGMIAGGSLYAVVRALR